MIGREYNIVLDVHRRNAHASIRGQTVAMAPWFVAGDRGENYLYLQLKHGSEIQSLTGYTAEIVYTFEDEDQPLAQAAPIIANEIVVAVDPRALLHGPIVQVLTIVTAIVGDSKLTLPTFALRILPSIIYDVTADGTVIEHHYDSVSADFVTQKILEHDQANAAHDNQDWLTEHIPEGGIIERINGQISTITKPHLSIHLVRDSTGAVIQIIRGEYTFTLNRTDGQIMSWEVDLT